MIFIKKPLGLPAVVVLSLLLGSIEVLSAQKFKKIRMAYTGFDVGVTISLIGKKTGLFKKPGWILSKSISKMRPMVVSKP